ncbi:GGDEF domain-containing protein [Chelatococcus sp. SYSU_G07232]|uniref:diguanylate cyclase n=1 Tax=Chelatococcus albus TaxID=3047466 RepID=A0ABT7ACH7_9HYPH|nr:GGDEF domain-containing protein [Chelatococcus sp. SYSU_G07232]MDJ1156727.1 GGDEF domain-containing protein [Chelatococcus sp. SYSU_G07232]
MTGQNAEVNPTYAIGEAAFERLKALGAPAHPRSYELWFTYVSAQRPALTAAVDRLLGLNGRLSDADIDELYDTHLSPHRFSHHAERASLSVLAEIDQVMEMFDLAMGSTARYGESLVTISKDLTETVDRARLRSIVEALVLATRDAAATNKTLEARLRETRGEISSLRESLEAVRLDALTDALTGVANRRHFDEMLVKAIDHATVSRTPLALVMIDVDHFKHFNDTYGHLTGDQVLRLVGATMREKVKTKATLARFGGEEFAVLLPDTLLETAHGIAETIRQTVMSRELVKRSTGESLGRVTLSLGVAVLRKGDTASSLLERADQCLLLAKRLGRNRTTTETELVANVA